MSDAMAVVWWLFGLLMVGLILRVRFYPEYDDSCRLCHRDIDSTRRRKFVVEYAVELGVARAYGEWFCCSYECQQVLFGDLLDGVCDV